MVLLQTIYFRVNIVCALVNKNINLNKLGQGPGFENPGHAGHMGPATFKNRQPHLAGSQAQLNKNGWVPDAASYFIT